VGDRTAPPRCSLSVYNPGALREMVCCDCSHPLVAQRDSSLRRTDLVAIGAEADINRRAASANLVENDPNRSFASKPKAPFLPTHFLDVSGVMLRTRWQA
jgi:hypothetical protein